MKTYKGKVIELIREKSSSNGNPRFTAVIQCARGFVTMATTSPDSSLAYGITNFSGKWVEYQTQTKRGRLTLVSIDKAELTGEGRYLKCQFERLPDSPVYKMQVTGCSDQGETGRTNWLNITSEQLKQIREILVNG